MDNFIIANRTDIGKARQVNEDSMVTFDSPNGRVVAVCDGMGGQAAGDVASQIACRVIQDILVDNTFDDPYNAITTAIMAANQGILHRVSQQPELEGMGSTCVLLIIRDGLVYYGWVGDSRIYVLADHKLIQISKDQSYVQMLVDQGELSPEEAENHPQKNEITNALGLPTMTPPMLCESPVEPEPGTIFMLCSDGLTNMVGAAQIERELNKTDLSLQEKASKLVFLANQYGGADNITLQLVEFVDPAGSGAASAPASPEAPAAKPKAPRKSNKGMFYTIIAAIIVILLAVLVYLFLAKGSDSDKTDEGANQTPNSGIVDERNDTPAPTATPAPTTTTAAPKQSTQQPTQSPSTTQKQNPPQSQPAAPSKSSSDALNKGITNPQQQSATGKALNEKPGQKTEPTPEPQAPKQQQPDSKKAEEI